MSFTTDNLTPPSPNTYVFKPLEDIKINELTELLPILIATSRDASTDIYSFLEQIVIPLSYDPYIEALSPLARRHFSQKGASDYKYTNA